MSDEQYIMAIDQGTTSSRAIIFDHQGHEIAMAQQEFPQYFPNPGWVEHDAMEIWDSVQSVISDVMIKSQIKPYRIAAIGLPTSGKRRSSGIATLANQSTMQSFGSPSRPATLPNS